MSEHKYLTDEQIKSMRNVAATIGIDEAGLNSVLSDLNALRAELTARDGPLSQDSPWHRWLAHTFPEIYAYISSLRAELMAAQKDRDRIQLYLDDATAENARMRTALEDIASGKGYPISDAMRALNQQLAQSETPKKFRSGYPAYTCRHCGSNHREHGESEECPQPAPQEKA